jgi:hypothetical protein
MSDSEGEPGPYHATVVLRQSASPTFYILLSEPPTRPSDIAGWSHGAVSPPAAVNEMLTEASQDSNIRLLPLL